MIILSVILPHCDLRPRSHRCFQVLAVLNVLISRVEPDVERAPAPASPSEPPGEDENGGDEAAELTKTKEKKKSKPKAVAE